ncbi:MAG: hypothetical protein AAFZ52_07290 [Bacteroidota bacterium]
MFFFRFLAGGMFVLLAASLTGQADNSDRVQWANSVRYGQSLFAPPSIEPERNGHREGINQRLEYELEARVNQRWSFLGIIGLDWLRTYQAERILSDPDDINDPFAMLHPYTSRQQTLFLQFGAQRNWRITKAGDLSIALLAGASLRQYYRAYDFINAGFNGIVVDKSKNVTDWQATARMQYTHWFSRSFGVQLGWQYLASGYLGGGVETTRGTRYRADMLESAVMRRRYQRNYDRSTLFPDPTVSLNRPVFFLGITQRF